MLTLKDKFDLLLEKMGMNNTAGSKVNTIKAPMPGLIIDLKIKVGDVVKQGDALLILADYASFYKEEFSNHFPWEMNIDVAVATNTENYFCIVANEYEYMGGAHPNGYVIYSNFDRATGSLVGLGSIFENGTKEKLTSIAEKLFRTQQNIDDSTTLADTGYFTLVEEGEEGKFFLNQNFLMEKNGIRFYYNKYEMAPYAAGPSEVFIPWQDIMHLVKKNFKL